MMTKTDTDQWIPQGYTACGIAILIGFSYVSSVCIGVLGYNPFSHMLIADILWGILSMWLCTGLFITAHDAMHGLILPQKPKLNALIGQICLGLYAGLSYKRLLRGHIEHHNHPSTTKDPDFWPSKYGPVAWYFRFMLEYITPIPIILVAGTYHTLVHVVGIDSGRLIAMWIVPQVLSSV